MAKSEAAGIKESVYTSVWIFGKFRRFLWKMLLESKTLLSSNFFHTNLLSFLEIQTLIKSHFLMPVASNLAVVIFSTCSISGILKVAAHNFMKSRSRDGLAARGLFSAAHEVAQKQHSNEVTHLLSLTTGARSLLYSHKRKERTSRTCI